MTIGLSPLQKILIPFTLLCGLTALFFIPTGPAHQSICVPISGGCSKVYLPIQRISVGEKLASETIEVAYGSLTACGEWLRSLLVLSPAYMVYADVGIFGVCAVAVFAFVMMLRQHRRRELQSLVTILNRFG